MMQENNLPEAPMVLYAQKARLRLNGEAALLSAGMAEVVQVRFTCSEDWAGLQKTAVFSNGTHSVDVPEEDWEDSVCTVPPQVLATAGKTVLVGLYGTDGERTVLPTVWCSLGRVEAGTVPACQRAMPPEAPIWAQLSQRLAALTPCTVLVSADANDALSADKAPAALCAAAQAGTPVRLVDAQGLCLALAEASQTQAVFTGISCEDGSFYAVRYEIDAQQAVTRLQISLQTQEISDAGGYFTDSTVEAALQALGAELCGINTLLGGGIA